MIHPILFALYLAYGGTPQAYEIAPRADTGYEVTIIDPWSGEKAGHFSAAGYERTDGRYTFLSYEDPVRDEEWRFYLKGHDGVFPACSSGGFNLMWAEGANLHVLRFMDPAETWEREAALLR